MIRAILRNGKIHPMKKLPAHWREGQRLTVAGGEPSDDPIEIKKWYKRLVAYSSEIPQEEHERLTAAEVEVRQSACPRRRTR